MEITPTKPVMTPEQQARFKIAVQGLIKVIQTFADTLKATLRHLMKVLMPIVIHAYRQALKHDVLTYRERKHMTDLIRYWETQFS